MAKQTVKDKAAKAASPQPNVPSIFDWQNPLLDLRKGIDQAFTDALKGWPQVWDSDPFKVFGSPAAFERGALSPSVEVAEADGAYEITAELPGLDEKDVEITVQKGLLTISGEKKAEREEKKKDYYLSERNYGAFKRTFRIPDDVESGKIAATMKNGVMTVTMPKSAESKAKARKISIGGR